MRLRTLRPSTAPIVTVADGATVGGGTIVMHFPPNQRVSCDFEDGESSEEVAARVAETLRVAGIGASVDREIVTLHRRHLDSMKFKKAVDRGR